MSVLTAADLTLESAEMLPNRETMNAGWGRPGGITLNVLNGSLNDNLNGNFSGNHDFLQDNSTTDNSDNSTNDSFNDNSTTDYGDDGHGGGGWGGSHHEW